MASLKELILEAIFPARCLSCRAAPENEGASPWLCENCRVRLLSRFETFCPVCGKQARLAGRTVCAHRSGALESVSALFLFKDRTVRKLVHGLKYNLVSETLAVWEALLKKERANLARLPVDAVVPLPLHRRKMRERGFNQSELVARIVGQIIGRPVLENVLQKHRLTPAQMKIKNPARRARNVRGAFRVINPGLIRGQSVLLVDDVITTGATLEEAARVLRFAGAKKTYGFVLARD